MIDVGFFDIEEDVSCIKKTRSPGSGREIEKRSRDKLIYIVSLAKSIVD